jgi:hypothetical protein
MGAGAAIPKPLAVQTADTNQLPLLLVVAIVITALVGTPSVLIFVAIIAFVQPVNLGAFWCFIPTVLDDDVSVVIA